MPRYDFRCLKCGREFEVSRPMRRAAEPAVCMFDGSICERVISMPATFVKGDEGTFLKPPGNTAQQQSAWSHFGHTHGPGSGSHTHGPGSAP